MKRIAVALACLASINICIAGEFHVKEQATVTALLVADWGQTRYIARSPDYHESWNRILGEYPTVGEVDRYFAASIILYNVTAYYLPPKWSKILSYSVGLVEISAIGNNAMIGVKFDF